MRALMIGTEEVAAIRATYEYARANPIPWERLKAIAIPEQDVTMVTLENRQPGQENARPLSYQVEIPHGFRMAISFEQQPAGLVAHFSFSVNDAPGKMPNQHAVMMLLGVIGYDLYEADEHWVEEFLINGESGGLAINLVYMIDPTVAGHA